MVLAITSLDVAFVAGIAAVAGAVAGPGVALVISRTTRRHERETAALARRFEARQEVYVQFLTDLRRDADIWWALAAWGRKPTGPDPGVPDMPDIPEIREKTTRAHVLCSPEMFSEFQVLLDLGDRFFERLVQLKLPAGGDEETGPPWELKPATEHGAAEQPVEITEDRRAELCDEMEAIVAEVRQHIFRMDELARKELFGE